MNIYNDQQYDQDVKNLARIYNIIIFCVRYADPHKMKNLTQK